MKIEFQLFAGSGAQKPESGVMEEWYSGQNKWRRTYTSANPRWNGSEWSVSRSERYISKPRHEEFADYELTLRVSRPAIDPLYQVANIRPQDDVELQRLDTGAIMLTCTMRVPSSGITPSKPEYSVPTFCFDKSLHLRFEKSEETVVQFDDIEPFQGRGVAKHVKILFNGKLIAEMKVTLLESASVPDETLLKPADNAVAQPYVIEPGVPRPVAIYEVGTLVPLLPGNRPFRGTLLVPVVIHKDGTVKVVRPAGSSSMQQLFDAVYIAVAKWKYQPYLVDGQPVEAAYNVPYAVDGKTFVPSYERDKTVPASTRSTSPATQ